jgi:formylglycine-generating enzyme required for sulfatase activity
MISNESKEKVNPVRLVEHLSYRAGLIVPKGEDVYTFPHRTFQEYLAACYLTDVDYPDLIARLSRKEPNRWREAALLAGAKAAGGSAGNIWSLAHALCYREPDEQASLEDMWGAHLAGQALLESADLSHVSESNQQKLDLIIRWLVRLLGEDSLPPVERALAGRNLARLGDPRTEVMTVDAIEFCLVPAGPFWMGEGESLHLNESLTYDYWASRYPVMNAQYRQFINARGYKEASYWKEAVKEGFWKDGKFKGRWDDDFREEPYDFGAPFILPNHPVVGVTWYEALAFTRWLTEKWQKEGILPKEWSIVLPSEAEWEKAARGGVEVVEQAIKVKPHELGDKVKTGLKPNPLPKRKYPWGDEGSENVTNCEESGINSTSAVGCFPSGVSPYGCEEMAGNVWEWTRSLYDFGYPYEPDDGRENLEADSSKWRTLRGGAYWNNLPGVGCGVRHWDDPSHWDSYWGFRCCASPQL